MIKRFLKWLKIRREEKYLTSVKYLISYDIANSSFTIPHDYLEKTRERFEELEKFKIRPEKFEELKMICKIRRKRVNLSLEDFYYGIPYTNTHITGTTGTSVTVYLRSKKSITSIPVGFLLNEKQWHLQNFNKQFDENILNDE